MKYKKGDIIVLTRQVLGLPKGSRGTIWVSDAKNFAYGEAQYQVELDDLDYLYFIRESDLDYDKQYYRNKRLNKILDNG